VAIISREEYKTLAGIQTDEYDDRIDAYIPLVEEAYMLKRNAPLEQDGVFPIGAKATAVRMLNWLLYSKKEEGQRSLNLGGGMSVQYDEMEFGFPAEIMREIRHYAKVIE